MNKEQLREITTRAKTLLRKRSYYISPHATDDYPERKITAADIIEVIKIGSAVALEPRELDGETKYTGYDRFRWFGEDQSDRVLRLIVVVQDKPVVLSAAEATLNQTAKYRAEDTEGLGEED